MAEQNRTDNDPNDPNRVVDPTLIGNSKPRSRETSETERKRIRNSNDIDQQIESGGGSSKRNRGYDEAVRGNTRDVDPDSPDAGIDRDDIGNV